MRKTINELLKQYKFDQEDAENAIDFVRDLLHNDIQYTKEHEPNATTSIYEMELAERRVQLLHELVQIDPDVSYLQNEWNLNEEEISTLCDEFDLNIDTLADGFRTGVIEMYQDYNQFFDEVHETLDKYDLIGLLKDGATQIDNIQYVELNGNYIWNKN